MRWHILRRGRIVASGPDPEALDRAATRIDRVVSDEDWWRWGWMRALAHPEPVAPVRVAREPRRPTRRRSIRQAERYRAYWLGRALARQSTKG